MSTKTDEVTSAAIKRAIEGRDGPALASFYADDAILRIVDRNNPPSRPREVKGRSAINTFWDDICSRAMTHKVDVSITEGNRLPSRRPALIRTAQRCSASPCSNSGAAGFPSKLSSRPGTSRSWHAWGSKRTVRVGPAPRSLFTLESTGELKCSWHAGRSTPASGTNRP